MLTVGDKFPEFKMKAAVSNTPSDDAFIDITNESYPGKWKVVFFYPKDFTFVCPTEIAAFGKLNDEFQDRDAQVLGGSVDNEYVHVAWRGQKEELKDLPFPLFSDLNRQLSSQLGILDEAEGV